MKGHSNSLRRPSVAASGDFLLRQAARDPKFERTAYIQAFTTVDWSTNLRLTMKETEWLAEHLHSVYLDGAWSAVSVRGAFQALSVAEAARHPIPGRHSAWEILLHLDAWHRIIARRLLGETVNPTPEEDWPEPPLPTDVAWNEALTILDAGLGELLGTIRSLDGAGLHAQIPGKRYTALEMAIGIGEHDLYHAGQVTLMKVKTS